MKTSNEEEQLFNIMDAYGFEDYQILMDEWIKVADGFLLVFAINDKESFYALEYKYKRIKKKKYP